MTRKHIDKIMKIMALAIKITSETAHDVMFDYSGHVGNVYVRIYPGGWCKNKNYEAHPDYIDMATHSYKSDDEIMAELDECIDTLNRFYESR